MLSPDQVVEAIESEGRRIGKLVEEITEAGKRDAEAEANYKSALAQTRLKRRAEDMKLTVGAVEDYALVETEAEYRAHLLARNNLMVLRESMRAATSRLDALRSIIATVRAAGG